MAIVIAECCQNHRGDLGLLREMIWAAAEAGADFAKIQSISSEELTFRERFEQGGRAPDGFEIIRRPFRAELERLQPMDLDDRDHEWFIAECEDAGIRPLTTVFSRSRVRFLAGLGWDHIKVASYDCASFPLLEELAERFRHLFISTGATTDAEIEQAAELLEGRSYSFLHCVTIYPTPVDQLHLARLDHLRQYTPSVGFSDHTLVRRDGLRACAAALLHGADVVERHFRILDEDQTRDGPVSIDPAQLAELVRLARLPREQLAAHVEAEVPDFELMLGSRERELSEAELSNRDYYRGRFASRLGDRQVYNWQSVELN